MSFARMFSGDVFTLLFEGLLKRYFNTNTKAQEEEDCETCRDGPKEERFLYRHEYPTDHQHDDAAHPSFWSRYDLLSIVL